MADTRPDLVVEAVERQAAQKIKQAGVLDFIQRKIAHRSVPFRKEIIIRSEAQSVKMVMHEDEAKIAGDIDFDKLRAESGRHHAASGVIGQDHQTASDRQ
ncbi:hypothetical protein [Cupriavidus necator]